MHKAWAILGMMWFSACAEQSPDGQTPPLAPAVRRAEASREPASTRLAAALAAFPPGKGCGPDWCRINPIAESLNWAALAGTSGDDMWLASKEDTVLHFDGTSLTTHPTGVGDVWQMFAAASDDVWAFGARGLAHWDGRAFQVVRTDIHVRSEKQIWGSSGSDIYFQAETPDKVFHWDGATLTPVDGLTSHNLTKMSGTASDDVWHADPWRPRLMRFDGTRWTVQKNAFVDAVIALARDDVWAVEVDFTPMEQRLIHYDGASWTVVQSWRDTGPLLELGGTKDDLWLVMRDKVMRFDGTAWQSFRTSNWFRTGYATSVGGETYVVSQALFRLGPTLSKPERLTKDPAPTLEATWGTGPKDVWAVGAEGTALHYDGDRVLKTETGKPYLLKGIWGGATNDVWAVGALGQIIHWNGVRWDIVPSHTNAYLTSVFTAGPGEDVWIGGENVLLRATAEGVVPVALADVVPTPVSSIEQAGLTTAISMHGSGADNVWALFRRVDGTRHYDYWLAHYDGKTWHAAEKLDEADSVFKDVHVAGPNDVWLSTPVVRANGKPFRHWDGASWSEHPADSPLARAQFPDLTVPHEPSLAGFALGEDVWSVGLDGMWFHRTRSRDPH